MREDRLFTLGTYVNYAHLLPSYLTDMHSVFKNERYKSHVINTIPFFRLENEEADIPLFAVAALTVWFSYGQEEPNNSLLKRYCFLDAEGYRIPDQSFREFNNRIDDWLEFARRSRSSYYAWFAI